MRIFLIGYMGSGKSSVGRALSSQLGCDFIDMDEEIEAERGMRIRDIFMKFGEHEFRNLESALLRELCEDGAKAAVISCGGGIILDAQNRELLRAQDTVFLDGDPRIMFERVKSCDNRPNAFLDIDDEAARLNAFVERYEMRRPLYVEAAARIVFVDGKSVGEVLGEVLLV